MTILVAYDPQTLDGAPIRFAAAVARLAAVPLVVASVRAGITPVAQTRDDLLDDELERLRSDLAQDQDIEVRTLAVEAAAPWSVARELRGVIEEEHASLAVVGSSRRGPIGRVVAGTTAQQVISGSSCPVAVVPADYDPPRRLSAVGVAFVPTQEGRRALRTAATIARAAAADLRVLTVVKPTLGADTTSGTAKEDAERNRAELDAAMAGAIADETDGVAAESEVVTGGVPDALLRVSAYLDLLVMGSRGYGPRLAVMLGGVSRRVTARAHCPVLVVPRTSTLTLAVSADTATTTMCKTVSNEIQGRQAATELMAAGVPGSSIHVLTGHPRRDVSDEAVGGFAGAVGPDAPVGSYAGAAGARSHGAGGFAGSPDQQRQGSFGDTDRGVILSFEAAGARSRITSHLELRRLMNGAGLADDDTDRLMDDLHAGHAVLLVELAGAATGAAHPRLEELIRAA